jgi:WD40 repeat protein
MSRIFLSHSRNDNFEAIALRDWLASEGWKDVFLDLDPERGIAAGQRWERALHDAASRCEAIIFLVSANWLGSGWCTKEYALARGLNKKLFAALIDPTRTIGSLPEELTGVWQLVDLVHGQDLRLFPTQLPGSIEERHIGYSRSGLTRLKRGLEKAGLDARFFPWPPEREPDRAPYRGLKSQEGDDAAIFFGRDAPIVDAIDRLRGLRAGAPPRLMAILGASGAGKSSFLRAGLLPRLNRDYAQFIPLPVVRPGRAALTGETGLVNALAAILPAHSRAELRTAVQGGAGALRPWLAELVQAAAARRDPGDESERPPAFVVAIDQAEELFRAEGREESESLLALLAQLAAGDDPTVIVIFTIRSDSYDALQSAKALEGLRQVAFSLLPMPRGAYNDVIEGPARRVEEAGGKLAIEPALTQRLLIDIEAGAGDALPLLAFTLEQLYLDYRQTGALRLVDYEKFGGIKGAIDAAAERALVRADADPRIPRDREARLALLRRGLIPWLAGVDPDTKTPRRNIARRADIPLEAAPLIDLLVEERLLSVDTRVSRNSKTGDETRESTIEPTHEALLRQWGLLDGWLTEDFGLLATLEGVKRTARDWDANARGDSWLAHQGQRLAEALALDGRPDIAARLDATDRAYLAGCRAREEAARDEAEQRRREREEEQARKLADARKIASIRAVAAVVAFGLAISAFAFGFYALRQKAIADGQTVEATSQRNKADVATKEAVAQKVVADKRTREAVAKESLALTALGGLEATRHPINAAKLSLASWPRSPTDLAPKLEQALDLMGEVVPQLRERIRIPFGGTFASFSPDGRKIVTAPADGTARVWNASNGSLLTTLNGHTKNVTFAAFSPDGNSVVTTSLDKTARLWDVATGQPRATLGGHGDTVWFAAFSPDSGRVVTASEDHTAQVWNAQTGGRIAVLEGHGDTVWSAAFSPDGELIVTASADKTARVWNAADGRERAPPMKHKDIVNSAAFSPDGVRVVTASDDKTARIWNAADAREIASLTGHTDGVISAEFSIDGSQVVTASRDTTARIWSASDEREIEPKILKHAAGVTSAAFSPDGRQVVTASEDHTARVWDSSTGREIATLSGHDGEVFCASFNKDQTRVVTVSRDDSTTRIWDLASGSTIVRLLEGHNDAVKFAGFSPDAVLVVTASADGTARIWSSVDGREVAPPMTHEKTVRSASYSSDGTRIVTASEDGLARIWDASTHTEIQKLKGHGGAVTFATFSLDGGRVVTASADKTARVWNARDGTNIATLSGHSDEVTAAVFNPSGTRVATASYDMTVGVWDPTSGRRIATLAGHKDEVASVVFSPDGQQILTASYDKTARLWDATTGSEIATLRGQSLVLSANFSADQTRIVTTSDDGTIRIWDAVSGRELATLRGHGGPVTSAAFSADGRRVISASLDGTARIWDVSPIPKGDILVVACRLLPDKRLDNLVRNYPPRIDTPICATNPPPPGLTAGSGEH